MKNLLLLFCLFIGISASAQKKETIKIPKGVVYNYADPKIVEEAKRLITQSLADSTDYKLCGTLLFVGPELWKRYKNIDSLKEIKGGNTILICDGEKLEAKTTQTAEDTKKVWDELRNEINGQQYMIRKLNEKELKYYWSIISWDIDEPLFVVETSSHKYIMNLSNKSYELIWLDEAP